VPTRRWRVAAAVGALLTLLTVSVASAAVPADIAATTLLDADQFVTAFDTADLDGLGAIGATPAFTGNASLDHRIEEIATARGYQRRPEADRPLTSIDGRLLQPEAAAAWTALRNAAAADGISMRLTSAYRSVSRQAELFRSLLLGTTDAAIDATLGIVAPPGYSRHHTGYTIDLGSEGKVLDAFITTAAHEWLSANNFENAKRYGWIPSYPEGAVLAGPDPEPWEYTWIGTTNIVCSVFTPSGEQAFCDAVGSTFESDIAWLAAESITTGCKPDRFCPDASLTRAEGATMIWRMSGSPEVAAPATFEDVPAGKWFSDAIAWMVETEVTTGTSPTMFSPDEPLTRAQFVTFLWRLDGRPDAALSAFNDVVADGFAATAVGWAVDVGVTNGTSPTTFAPEAETTRGQTAAFLRRFDSLPETP
jgi:D-alanyl-D-alanine carboxypeptidase-like protein/S-layer family protein